MAGKFGSVRSVVSGVKESQSDFDCGTFCQACRACADDVMDRAKSLKLEANKNPSLLKGRDIGQAAGASLFNINKKNSIAQNMALSNPGTSTEATAILGKEKPKEEKADKEGKDEKKAKVDKDKDKKEEATDKNEIRKNVKGEEIVITSSKEDDLKYKGRNTSFEQQAAQGTKFSNQSDLQRHHLLNSQKIIAANAQDYSLASRITNANVQADLSKNHQAAAVSKPAPEAAYAKLQQLMSNTILQAVYLRNILRQEVTKATEVQKTRNVNVEITPKVQERLKQIERAIDTVVKHMHHFATKNQMRAIQDANNGLKIMNRVAPETKKTALYRETVRENLAAAAKALNKVTDRKVRLKRDRPQGDGPVRNIKLRPLPGKRLGQDASNQLRHNTKTGRQGLRGGNNARQAHTGTRQDLSSRLQKGSIQQGNNIRTGNALKIGRTVSNGSALAALRNQKSAINTANKNTKGPTLNRDNKADLVNARHRDVRAGSQRNGTDSTITTNRTLSAKPKGANQNVSVDATLVRKVSRAPASALEMVAKPEVLIKKKLNFTAIKEQVKQIVPQAIKERLVKLVESVKKIADRVPVATKAFEKVTQAFKSEVVRNVINRFVALFVKKTPQVKAKKHIVTNKKSVIANKLKVKKALEAAAEIKKLFDIEFLMQLERKRKLNLKELKDELKKMILAAKGKDLRVLDVEKLLKDLEDMDQEQLMALVQKLSKDVEAEELDVAGSDLTAEDTMIRT